MYKLCRPDGTPVAIADDVMYIRRGRSGALTPTTIDRAVGVAVDGTAYNLPGHDEIDGETVTVQRVSAAAFALQTEQNAANLDYVAMMSGIELPEADDTEEIADESEI